MQNGGEAIMGTGIARGEERAILAAQEAINSPLLQNKSIKGARGVLINITSSEDLGIHELNQASDLIYKAAGYDSSSDYDQEYGELIHGFTVDNTLNDEVRVTVIATGLDQEDEVQINENKVQTNENRYQTPDHDYNNPQTSINILNSNNDKDEVSNANIKEDTLIKTDDEVQVFGEDLEVPTYLRNRTID
jgi:cell division protein FtsZ